MFAVDPFSANMIVEAEYRGLNYGEKPVYRLVDGIMKQVGTKRAAALFQPSFKRYRTDKEMKPDDLRLSQVAGEGEGKWLGNPNLILEPQFSLPPGLVNPQTTFEGEVLPRDRIDARISLEKFLEENPGYFVPDYSHYPKAVLKLMEKEGIQTVNQLTNATGYDENSYVVNADTFAQAHAIKLSIRKSKQRRTCIQTRSDCSILLPNCKRTQRVPMHLQVSTRLKHIYNPSGDIWAAQLYSTPTAAEADRTNYLRVCRENFRTHG